jgi:hypothetical protein
MAGPTMFPSIGRPQSRPNPGVRWTRCARRRRSLELGIEARAPRRRRRPRPDLDSSSVASPRNEPMLAMSVMVVRKMREAVAGAEQGARRTRGRTRGGPNKGPAFFQRGRRSWREQGACLFSAWATFLADRSRVSARARRLGRRTRGLPFFSVGDVLGGPQSGFGPRSPAWPGGRAGFTASIPSGAARGRPSGRLGRTPAVVCCGEVVGCRSLGAASATRLPVAQAGSNLVETPR